MTLSLADLSFAMPSIDRKVPSLIEGAAEEQGASGGHGGQGEDAGS